jgi:hypothetical protein
MMATSPSNDENLLIVTPLYSPLKLKGDEGGVKRRLHLSLINGRGEVFKKLFSTQ